MDKRYIEFEKTRETFVSMLCARDVPCKNCNIIGRCLLYKTFDKIPIADVAPVKHGRWIKARGSWCTPGGDPVWECSECGKGMHVYGVEHGSYGSDVADGQWVACPNCGALMDKDGDEE